MYSIGSISTHAQPTSAICFVIGTNVSHQNEKLKKSTLVIYRSFYYIRWKADLSSSKAYILNVWDATRRHVHKFPFRLQRHK